MNPITLLITAILGAIGALLFVAGLRVPGIAFGVLAVLTLYSLKMANNWERFVILRAGKLSSVKGRSVRDHSDHRQHHRRDRRAHPDNAFNAEQALTRDTVPVNVDAVIFWHVHDAQRAALNITDYRQAIDRVAQTCCAK